MALIDKLKTTALVLALPLTFGLGLAAYYAYYGYRNLELQEFQSPITIKDSSQERKYSAEDFGYEFIVKPLSDGRHTNPLLRKGKIDYPLPLTSEQGLGEDGTFTKPLRGCRRGTKGYDRCIDLDNNPLQSEEPREREHHFTLP